MRPFHLHADRPRAGGGPWRPALLTAVLLAAVLLAPPAPAADPGAFAILSEQVPAGQARRLWLDLTRSFAGARVRTPVLVTHGAKAGPALCLVAAIHGDELNGIEIARRIVERTDPSVLAGTLVAVPIANPPAFRAGSRYLPDRRDLNRHFPGNARGSLAARVAHKLFDTVVQRCTHLVDLHSGSGGRVNLPQVRGDARDEGVRQMLAAFRLTAVHGAGGKGTLRRAAADAGVLAVLYEAGEANRFDTAGIDAGVAGVTRLMASLGMTAPADLGATPEQPLFARSGWVRADTGGILLGSAALGSDVSEGTVLGQILDPVEGVATDVVSPMTGRVVGRAVNQLVMPGFGIFHVATDPLAPGAQP